MENYGLHGLQPEKRLYWLLYTVRLARVVLNMLTILQAPCLAIGLFGFAWTSTGPPLPWIAPLIFSAIVGIANYAIYMATIDCE